MQTRDISFDEVIMQAATITSSVTKLGLMWGGKRVTKSEFRQIRIVNIFEADDKPLGIVHYPSFAENGSNTFIVVEREGNLVRVPQNKRPERIPYSNEDYWKSAGITRTQHNHQYHLFRKKEKGLKELIL